MLCVGLMVCGSEIAIFFLAFFCMHLGRSIGLFLLSISLVQGAAAPQCSEPEHSVWIGNEEFTVKLTNCAAMVLAHIELTAKCLVRVYNGLTLECARCFGQTSQCALRLCVLQCFLNQGSAACRTCIASNCTPTLLACTGSGDERRLPPVPRDIDATTTTTTTTAPHTVDVSPPQVDTVDVSAPRIGSVDDRVNTDVSLTDTGLVNVTDTGLVSSTDTGLVSLTDTGLVSLTDTGLVSHVVDSPTSVVDPPTSDN